jgi:hypothetical protein
MNKNRDYSIPVRTYSKQELAMYYFPGDPVSVAQQHLRRWIRNCKALHQELEAMDMGKKNHHYTPRQVEAIMRYLGDP